MLTADYHDADAQARSLARPHRFFDLRTWPDDHGGGLVVDGHGPVVLGEAHHQLRVVPLPLLLVMLLLLLLMEGVVSPVRVRRVEVMMRVVMMRHLLLVLLLLLLHLGLLLLMLEMRRHCRKGHAAVAAAAAARDKEITPLQRAQFGLIRPPPSLPYNFDLVLRSSSPESRPQQR